MPVDELRIHKDHAADRFEHQLWQEDIERWRREHAAARAMLEAAQASWEKADAALEQHAEDIRRHEAHVRRHEEILAAHADGEPDLRPDETPEEHEQLEALHLAARRNHQRLQEYHVAVIEEIRELLRTAVSGDIVPEV